MGNSAITKLYGLDILVGDFGWPSALLINTSRTSLRTNVHSPDSKDYHLPMVTMYMWQMTPFWNSGQASLASLLWKAKGRPRPGVLIKCQLLEEHPGGRTGILLGCHGGGGGGGRAFAYLYVYLNSHQPEMSSSLSQLPTRAQESHQEASVDK